MRTDWILFALLSLLWLAAGGMPWSAFKRKDRNRVSGVPDHEPEIEIR